MNSIIEKIKENWPLFTILFLSVIALLGVFLLRGSNISQEPETDKRESVTVIQNGEKITVFRSGRVVRTRADGSQVEEFWSSEKTAAFFDYYWETYGLGGDLENITVGGEGGLEIDPGDELSDIIFADDEDGEGDDGGGGGSQGDGGLDDYFPSPSPTNPGGDYTPPPGGGEDGDGEGGGSEEPECLFWRLSYCVIFPTPTPAVPTPTPPGVIFYEPTCEDVGNQQTGKTVIGDELCISEPESE